MCSAKLEAQRIEKIIDIPGYKDWFKNQKENQSEIRTCFEGSTKHSLRLMMCCGELSLEILQSMHKVFCLEKAQHVYNIYCSILHLTTRTDVKELMLKFMDKSKICHNRCPLDPESQKIYITNDIYELEKRQFDLASSFDVIGQFVCSDMIDGSTIDAWDSVLDIANKDNHFVQDGFREFFVYAFLIRKPSCCLLKPQFRG